jgi:hypothetical protein
MYWLAGNCDSIATKRLRARFLLIGFALVAAFFVAITCSSLKSGFADASDRGPGDIGLYKAEVERIRNGQSYYDAADTELHARGYPTRSVFNWRSPWPVALIAALPEMALAKAILGGLGVVLICLSFQLLAVEAGIKQALFGVGLLTGALMPCVLGDLCVLSELWSGVLIALSAVCFGLQRRGMGVLAGIAALFFRELAAPYCLACMALNSQERRWKEVGLWAVGLALYAVFYALHVRQVLPRITADDVANARGWIRFGGAGFLISTAQMNAYLLLLPQWITALYLTCALLGSAGWNSPAGRLVAWTIIVYAVAFSVAGNDFNQYWGSMTAPLFCLAVGRSAGVLNQLWHDAQWTLPTVRYRSA